jgi:ubiquinone biosynthesis monooxygenase Coq6
VVIIGGGPAGLTLATALNNSPVTQSLKVALIEGSSLDKIRKWQSSDDKFSNRVSSLTPKSVHFLTKIGAWDHIERDRVKEYDEMVVWDGCSDSRIEFQSSVLAEYADIAYMVENLNLQQSLIRRIDELQNEVGRITMIDSTKVKSIGFGSHTEALDLSSWPVVELENGIQLGARLLVGADGANSPVRQFSGIKARGWDYNRHGLVASVKLEWEDTFKSVAWQRFLVTGPLALLPMPNGYATLVWSTTPENARFLKSLDNESFCAMVNAGFRLRPADLEYLHKMESGIVEEVKWRLDNTPVDENQVPMPIVEVQDESRACFPLRMRHADTYVKERIALVGDAAHTTHPLAGQGLNMGQGDVAHLIRAIESSISRGLDIGSLLSLEPYWKDAYLTNHIKLGVFDKLHKLYSTDFTQIVQVRSLGLNVVNSLDWVKSQLMRQAST